MGFIKEIKRRNILADGVKEEMQKLRKELRKRIDAIKTTEEAGQ